MSWLFTSGGQSIRAPASVLQMSIQGWFPPGSTGLISLQSEGLSKRPLQHHSLKASALQCSAFFMVQLSHPHMTTGKTIALTVGTFVGKVVSLLFNTLSRFVIAFFPNKCLSFHGCSHYPQWFWSPRKSVNCFYFSRYIQKETKSANILISVVSCSYTGIHCH